MARRGRADLEATQATTASAVYREFDELRAALDGLLGIEAVLDVLGDDPVISAAYGGAHVPIATAASSLTQELTRQDGTLADQEEQLFEAFLFGDVANELRARISDADAIVLERSEPRALPSEQRARWDDQRRKEMVGLHAIDDGSESRAA